MTRTIESLDPKADAEREIKTIETTHYSGLEPLYHYRPELDALHGMRDEIAKLCSKLEGAYASADARIVELEKAVNAAFNDGIAAAICTTIECVEQKIERIYGASEETDARSDVITWRAQAAMTASALWALKRSLPARAALTKGTTTTGGDANG